MKVTGDTVESVRYYQLTLTVGDDGSRNFSAYSHCIGLSVLNPDWEVRTASLVNPQRIIEMHHEMDLDLWIVNTTSDLAQFLVRGGSALVEQRLAEQVLLSTVAPWEVRRSGAGFERVSLESALPEGDSLLAEPIEAAGRITAVREPCLVQQLRAALRPVSYLRDRLNGLVVDAPRADGATAHIVTAQPPDAGAYALASIWTALNHLESLRDIVQADVQHIDVQHIDVQFTILRAAYEAALVAAWVSDPDEEDPQVRALAVRAADLDERAEFERSCGRSGAAEVRADLLAEAARQGLTRLDVNKRVILASNMPSMVTLGNTYVKMRAGSSGVGPSEWTYRLMSGYSHGKSWALSLLRRGDDQPSVLASQRQGGQAPLDHHEVELIGVVVSLLDSALSQAAKASA